MRKTFDLLGRTFGREGDLFVIAGPDVCEPEDLCLRLAERLRKACERLGIGYIFKGSFDKANRTSADAYRGPGLDRGLRTLSAVRARAGVPVLTDVHEVWQVAPAAEVVDVLQVPAFLCRQTDLVEACARTGKVVNVKKGQFLAPEDMRQVARKIEAAGGEAARAILTERGTTFGYRMLVSDLRSIPIMQETGYPVCYDATHSQQIPAGHGAMSGGLREMVAPMARAAVAAGADGCFFEVHEDPERALVDADTHIEVEALESLLGTLVEIKRALARPQR
jgi:2-dehydro-3-deoxyphosphooctonate aldolase (KDO 8-P synthase)